MEGESPGGGRFRDNTQQKHPTQDSNICSFKMSRPSPPSEFDVLEKNSYLTLFLSTPSSLPTDRSVCLSVSEPHIDFVGFGYISTICKS